MMKKNCNAKWDLTEGVLYPNITSVLLFPGNDDDHIHVGHRSLTTKRTSINLRYNYESLDNIVQVVP